MYLNILAKEFLFHSSFFFRVFKKQFLKILNSKRYGDSYVTKINIETRKQSFQNVRLNSYKQKDFLK